MILLIPRNSGAECAALKNRHDTHKGGTMPLMPMHYFHLSLLPLRFDVILQGSVPKLRATGVILAVLLTPFTKGDMLAALESWCLDGPSVPMLAVFRVLIILFLTF